VGCTRPTESKTILNEPPGRREVLSNQFFPLIRRRTTCVAFVEGTAIGSTRPGAEANTEV
jgi:hypothetical protein